MLMKVFFSVAHDPTELNYQGPDVGTQYRSVIFYATDEQRRVTEEYTYIVYRDLPKIAHLQKAYPDLMARR
jgi:peptide-methionine (S)-S-oxide reductase